MADTLNVIAICGSLRKGSFNRMLMNTSIGLAPTGMTIKEAPSFASFPIYNFDDQQATGIPKVVDSLNDAIKAADGVLVVSAEYNWSIPGGLKNAIDWASREKEVCFKDKPVALQSAAPGLLGGGRMQYHLRMALTAIEAQMFGKPEVFVNLAAKKIDEKTGELTDQAAKDAIKLQLAAFAKFIKRVKV
jgi:chromate reductase